MEVLEFDNLRRMWTDASARARLGIVLGVLLILAILIYSVTGVLRPDYQTLFTDLDPQDTATLVAELERMKVPYRLGPDETSILVPGSQVHATRIKLMGKGVAMRGGVGFEIFNNNDFGMTEFAQKINYQRALQGELTRTIAALDEVRNVRVHLVMPESGLFRKSAVRPKAAITLAMKPGRHVQPEQVLGIQRLVAAAVPEIEPGAVTIVDDHGVTLTRPFDPFGEDGSEARFSAKGEAEQYFMRKVVAIMDRTFGAGRAIVSVDVTLNHDQVKVTREDVIPANTRGTEAAGILTRKRTTTTVGSGVVDDIARAGPGTGGVATSEAEYQNGRRVEQVVSLPGSIRRLSVGVMLPHGIAADRLEELRRVIAMAVGLNPDRGDEIAIASLTQFGPAPAASAAPGSMPSAEAPATPEQAASAPSADGDEGARPPVRALWFWTLVVLGVLLVLGLVYAVAERLRQPRLSPAARERLLARMREWLAAEEQRA
ncbi:MAG: flagellar basal-body MS-ring/collar protein FliF [Rhizobacter sp.]